ncbi:MAG TPA: transcriptional regulator NrdR [Clostridiales bacterium]|nr:transcriptional regulator NrdR [Clostridiales bacterium]HBY32609.1 transcriptional regulator NrdR [Clostridiales bacterium]HBZ78268.1 transcriptional regulator NrdR [Clostridiales bacterium]
MKCPFCGHMEDKVIDSRPAEDGSAIRRRRECLSCSSRFTTYEKVELLPLLVIKKDGTREAYSQEKLLGGLMKACEKRPVSSEQLTQIVSYVENQIQTTTKREISTNEIGEMVMQQLKGIDEVAYVRFASVYRQFKDVNSFMDELKDMLKK